MTWEVRFLIMLFAVMFFWIYSIEAFSGHERERIQKTEKYQKESREIGYQEFLIPQEQQRQIEQNIKEQNLQHEKHKLRNDLLYRGIY